MLVNKLIKKEWNLIISAVTLSLASGIIGKVVYFFMQCPICKDHTFLEMAGKLVNFQPAQKYQTVWSTFFLLLFVTHKQIKLTENKIVHHIVIIIICVCQYASMNYPKLTRI